MLLLESTIDEDESKSLVEGANAEKETIWSAIELRHGVELANSLWTGNNNYAILAQSQSNDVAVTVAQMLPNVMVEGEVTF